MPRFLPFALLLLSTPAWAAEDVTVPLTWVVTTVVAVLAVGVGIIIAGLKAATEIGSMRTQLVAVSTQVAALTPVATVVAVYGARLDALEREVAALRQHAA